MVWGQQRIHRKDDLESLFGLRLQGRSHGRVKTRERTISRSASSQCQSWTKLPSGRCTHCEFSACKVGIVSGKVDKWRTFYFLFTRKWHHVINFEWTSCSISWMQSNIGYLFFIDHIVYFICSSFHEIEQDRHSKFITWCQILGNCINCIRNMRHFSIFPIWFTGVVRI